jgi:hypothetical protein
MYGSHWIDRSSETCGKLPGLPIQAEPNVRCLSSFCIRGFNLLEEIDPTHVLDFDWRAFYSTKVFKDDKWAIHYYAPIQGHELVTRRDVIPSEPDQPRAGGWYYNPSLDPLEHKLPPIVSHRWRRATYLHRRQRRPLHECRGDQRPVRARKLGGSAICESEGAGYSVGYNDLVGAFLIYKQLLHCPNSLIFAFLFCKFIPLNRVRNSFQASIFTD